jgi:hypothetical protein
MEKTLVNGKDTILKGRLISTGEPWIRLTGRIFNNSENIIILQKDDSPNTETSFKMEYLYKNKSYIIYLHFEAKEGAFDDIILGPKKYVETSIESYIPFNRNKEIFANRKKIT